MRGASLVLRGMFPPPPGEIKSRQQRLPLGVPASAQGVAAADATARSVGRSLIDGSFDWSQWGRGPTRHETIAQWVTAFELDYWQRRAKTPKTLTTWNSDYKRAFDQLPGSAALTVDLLREIMVDQTDPDTRKRKRFCFAFSRLGRFAGLNVESLGKLRGEYGLRRVNPRIIPSQDAVMEWAFCIPNPKWQYVYRILLLYGPRASEVHTCHFIPGSVELHITDGKTGPRVSMPYPRELAEQWQIWKGDFPKCTGATNSDLGQRTSRALARYGVPFSPTLMRHYRAVAAWGHVPVEIDAASMGHSVEVHQRVYWHWANKEKVVTDWGRSHSR